MDRRTFLRLMAAGGVMATRARPLTAVAGAGNAAPRSLYGRWTVRDGLPAFVYELDQDAEPAAEWDPILAPPTRRNWVMLGNRAIRLQAANDGTVALFDEGDGLRWLVAPDPDGTGISILRDGGREWGSAYAMRGGERPPRRTFGPTWFEVEDAFRGLVLTRTILCPEGEVPWVLVHVRLALARSTSGARRVQHIEQWRLRPRFLNLLETAEVRRTRAEAAVGYDVAATRRGLVATERFAAPTDPGPAGAAARFVIGPPATLVLESLGGPRSEPGHRLDGGPHPVLEITTDLQLAPGEHRDLWFRFGRRDGSSVAPRPQRVATRARRALTSRLPRASAPRAPEAAQEIPWHAALLTGGLAVD